MKVNSRRLMAATLLALGAGLLTGGTSQGANPHPEPASGPGYSCRSGAGGSYGPIITPDGRFVLFSSQARNLTTNDSSSPHLGLYVRDLVQGQTVLVSVQGNGVGGANEDALAEGISTNGPLAVFTTWATNLVDGDTNRYPDVFVRDLAMGTTIPVTVARDGARLVGGGGSMMSQDGRWVFFGSTSSNLVAEPSGRPAMDIFARDLHSNQTYLVSDAVDRSGLLGSLSSNSELAGITPDGRRVAFLNQTASRVSMELLVRDMQDGRTVVASTNLGLAFQGAGPVTIGAALSADGSSVAFLAHGSPDPYSRLLFRHVLDSQETTLIATNVPSSTLTLRLGISADGRFVAYADGTNVWVWDGLARSNILVSVNRDGSGPALGVSQFADMTLTGQHIAFLSTATDLVTNQTEPGSCQIYVRDLAMGTTVLASIGEDGGPCRTDLELATVALTPDGTKVAFDSLDDRLVSGDANQASDVFVRDLVSGTTSLVSERQPSLPAMTAPALGTLANASCLSSNATRVAFTSPSIDHEASGTNGSQTVFVRDFATGDSYTVGPGAQAAGDPVLSANGEFVAYTRWFTYDLSGLGTGDIYRCHVSSGATELVSARLDGTPAGLSSRPAISPDGRYVAFQSRAGDLVSQGTPVFQNIFLRDMTHGTNMLISMSLAGAFADGESLRPTFSPDGRWLIFQSHARNLVSMDFVMGDDGVVYAHDLLSTRTTVVSKASRDTMTFALGVGEVTVSPDSRWVVFEHRNRALWVRDLMSDADATMVIDLFIPRVRHPAICNKGEFLIWEVATDPPTVNAPEAYQIVLLHRPTGTTNFITTDHWETGLGNGSSTSASISARGQFVVFASQAANLVPDDTNGVSDVFVYDRLNKRTTLVSLTGSGQLGNGPSTRPVLSQDNRSVVFQSHASNFADRDYNHRRDVFVLRLSLSDTDDDGMDDDWEMAFFDTLDRDGAGDFDEDGLSDLDEFNSGTDPTDQGSVLRVMTLTSLGDGNVVLLWSAVPGRTYRVEFKNSLEDDAWSTVPGAPTFVAGTASLLDPTARGWSRRFYRVLVLP